MTRYLRRGITGKKKTVSHTRRTIELHSLHLFAEPRNLVPIPSVVCRFPEPSAVVSKVHFLQKIRGPSPSHVAQASEQ